MRRTLLVLVLISSISLNAQEVNISMSTSYVSDVYVSMETGEVSTVDATDWHLAFDVRNPFSVAIRVNDGHGTTIKNYNNGDISAWDALDTTGFISWPALHNLTDSWDNGALNQSYSGDPSDFSWGYYTGDPLHDVVGDSLYIIQAGDSFKKFRIDKLDAGAWTFTTADLDGSNEVETTFGMGDYADRNFAYFNVVTNELIDREPASGSWDLVFTRYFGMTAFGPGATTGTLANSGVELIRVDGVNPDDAIYTDYTWTTDNIGLVGNDWKNLNMEFVWEIVADRTYFVKNAAGDVYQVTFTSFGGTGTGDIAYNVELISGSSVGEINGVTDMVVYPNPTVSGNLNVRIETTKATQASLEIYNVTGQIAHSTNVNLSAGVQTLNLNNASLNAGTYILKISTVDGENVRPLIIR
ncbi:MAG: T9SS type A sorting domain-containing protein [Flavobacteriales bacterium]|nr:T9SS type A sorting domain-containing protein [Flavobacteriales bacterium]